LGISGSDLERNAPLSAALLGLVARRLLIELPSARSPAAAIALVLPIESLLGTELLALHRAWAVAQWSPMTFIVDQDEALADRERYRYVRQMLKGLGHRLGVHGLSPERLRETGSVESDLRAMRWLPAYGDGTEHRAEPLSEGQGADLLITEVHTREALGFARKIGAGLIAGRQAERLLGV
jgi:hypothetical protein